jgi:hypothetical protein
MRLCCAIEGVALLWRIALRRSGSKALQINAVAGVAGPPGRGALAYGGEKPGRASDATFLTLIASSFADVVKLDK